MKDKFAHRIDVKKLVRSELEAWANLQMMETWSRNRS